MAKFKAKDISRNIKSSLQGSSEKLKETVKDIKVPEIKKPDSVKDIFKKNEREKKSPIDDVEAPQGNISAKNAMKIIFYLMAIDGDTHRCEEEKFVDIGKELDPKFDEWKAEIVEECRLQLQKVIDPEDLFEASREGVGAAIRAPRTAESVITPKLLVWNLMTIAYSDEDYAEAERTLIKHVVREMNVGKDEFLELESSIQTLIALERQEKWIKNTNRPYLEIEKTVNEIEKRKEVIFDSVKELVML